MAINTTSLLSDVAFGLDLLSLVGSNVDIVGIYNDTAQVYVQARPLKASVRETSKVMEHPVETGVVLSDHHIINPVEIDLPLMVASVYYAAIYQQIKTDFLAATLLSVKTPVNVYGSMIVADMPHEESPEHFSSVIIGLRLKQVLFEVPGSTQPLPANYSPAAAANENTVQSGLQSAAALGTRVLAGATSLASYAALVGKR
ncbi:phage baseplate protein [Fimbriiglobus ruber]|uniref:Phage protein n=1 Tax=Fimbriiglobus ruber TaxID=1908690 RepID=A0A225DL78_9BACT|nr:hypothetical protein [Fimbriiglobus ruber]OWK42201.1 Phage protein [Fimbriiglobus ruber]